MCATCGCGAGQVFIRGKSARQPGKPDEPMHFRARGSKVRAEDIVTKAAETSRIVRLEQDILARNDACANANRKRLAEAGILALNLVSSPGSGKTTLLVRTLRALKGRMALAVVEGDQQTDNDAERIRATGVEAIQINTGKGCHLDAQMVARAMQQMTLPEGGVLFIENVGNLVCPAAFDLGEAAKVVVLSVTEGEDKPLKYPDMFRAASLMLLNKCDLLPHLTFDAELAIEYARRVNPDIRIIRISATSGAGMEEWLDWIAGSCRNTRQHVATMAA
ncbi:MAG: hydrogenase nickel incorporation protein HypB [Nitrosomonadales bacterium]|nr:hydrogenase nickel incorporation protein HypB [Nitrosomonadales bacterium]